MLTGQQFIKLLRLHPAKYSSYRRCSCCSLYGDARNGTRHAKACNRRRIQFPNEFRLWKSEFHGAEVTPEQLAEAKRLDREHQQRRGIKARR